MKTVYHGLVCTHHLLEWAGSETVTVEIIEELQRQGCELSLYCPYVNRDFLESALGSNVTFIGREEDIDISRFDFVYSHHQMPSRFILQQPLVNVLGKRRPVFVYNHLSSFEPFEFPGPWCEEQLADIILCNSPETADRLCDFGERYSKTLPFYNPAPRAFESTEYLPNDGELKKVLAISNHITEELSEAFDLLSDQGVSIKHIGNPSSNRRVVPGDLAESDAVITIGKSVQYSLRSRRPVFCYDHFGGPGWLDGGSFSAAAAKNFSGRCSSRQMTAAELTATILNGYSKARDFTSTLPASELKKYLLENCVSNLLKKIGKLRHKDRAEISSGLIEKLAHEKELYGLLDREYEARLTNEPVATEVVVRKELESTSVRVNEESAVHAYPNIKTGKVSDPDPGKSRVIAIFAFRYDEHLVPGLLENIAPFVHGWVAWDDRFVDDEFTGDATRRKALFDVATSMGADWILAADPDERFENGLADKIDNLTNENGLVCWMFDCRELFEPLHYRVDGLWHDRPRVRLYPCQPGMEPDTAELHSQWTTNKNKIVTKSTGLCFYHLRMSTVERRRHRRDLYAAADPERQFQKIGYDYIDDDRGMDLEQIQPDRMYFPLLKEDNGLWAPDIELVGDPKNDPLNVQLCRLETTLFKGGGANGACLAADIYEESGMDIDLGLLAVELNLRVGNCFKANRICKELVNRYPDLTHPRMMYSRVLRELGRYTEAHSEAKNIVEGAEYKSVILSQEVLRSADVTDRLYGDGSLWRRWTQDAELFNGVHVGEAEMAVIVIGYQAPLELNEAVTSLRAQDEEVEIVVVNSGGGEVADVLKEHLEYIRVIAVEERLFVGSARNIGIDASTAPYIAFLASDCTAKPGWVRNRMRRHRAGASAVASAVVPSVPENYASLAAHFLMHWRRRPLPETPVASRYGVSCSRCVFESCGYFPTGLRLGEDTSFNETLRKTVGIAWAPDVISTHLYPTDEKLLLEDMHVRGTRRAQYAPFSNHASFNDLDTFTGNWSKNSIQFAIEALRDSNTLDKQGFEIVSDLIRKASAADVAGIKEGWQAIADAKNLLAKPKSEEGYPESRSQLEHAVSLWPQSVKPKIQLALLLHSTDKPEDTQRSIELLREAVNLTPTSAESLSKLCKILEETGDSQSALRYAEVACMMSPTQLPFWWELNGAASRTGNLVMQLLALQKIVIINPTNQTAQTILSRLYKKCGDQCLADQRSQLAEILE